MRFCITGTGRSGTTLLRHLFNSHPDLFVFHETHWIPKMFEFFGTGTADVKTMVQVIEKTRHVTGQLVTELELPRLERALGGRTRMSVAQFCNIVGTHCAEMEGKRLWADKTPDYGPYLGVLTALWPKCRFVHIIRHGVEVAHSMAHHPGFRWMVSAGELWWVQPSFNRYYQMIETVDAPIERYLELWYWRLQRIRNEVTRLPRDCYLEVRFEDLIHDPPRILRRVAHFVELPVSEEWVSRAVTLVDEGRIHWRASRLDVRDLRDDQLQLLASLGYDAAK